MKNDEPLFREGTVRLALGSDCSAKLVAEEIGVKPNTLGKRRQQLSSGDPDGEWQRSGPVFWDELRKGLDEKTRLKAEVALPEKACDFFAAKQQ